MWNSGCLKLQIILHSGMENCKLHFLFQVINFVYPTALHCMPFIKCFSCISKINSIVYHMSIALYTYFKVHVFYYIPKDCYVYARLFSFFLPEIEDCRLCSARFKTQHYGKCFSKTLLN